MNIDIQNYENIPYALLEGEGQIINDVDDMVDLIGNSDYLGSRKVIVQSEQLHPDFFELSSGFAGEVLQKISNYRMQLAVIGDFSQVNSKALRDFIRESNKQGRVCFVEDMAAAHKLLS